jgi:hypothetical protein
MLIKFILTISILLGSLSQLLLSTEQVYSKAPKYSSPSLTEYYKSLMQPDQPNVSCCGAGDAYFANKLDSCLPSDGLDCSIVAIITDTRDDSTYDRQHIDVGTRIPIPKNKIRLHPIPNPTDNNIVFVSPYNHYVYCWEPTSGI